jgi:capsule polysaccharide modification protein KpsS
MSVATKSSVRPTAIVQNVPRDKLPELGVERALLLQGPMGPFFSRFAEDLRAAGIDVLKVHLNAGDSLFYAGEAVAYRGTLEAWPSFIERLLRERNIDGVFVFGDGRPYHRAAIAAAEALSVPVFVFEEGYLRPNHITFERGGVNGYSSLPRDPSFYRAFEYAPLPAVDAVLPPFGATAWYSTLYSLALTFAFFRYPRYLHHRPLNAFSEAYRWVVSGLVKLWYTRRDKRTLERLVTEHAGQFFVLTLQVHCDFQLRHSPFQSVEDFISHAVASFAKHAPKDTTLVVKHHPLDRAYRNYKSLLARLTREHGLSTRLIYVHDLHLPTLLRASRGTVMINSTVGLQAVGYGTPVKVLGTAVYDMAGLTSQRSLEDFWAAPDDVDEALYNGFRNYLLRENQVNGGFYRRLVHRKLGAGLLFPATWGRGHEADDQG